MRKKLNVRFVLVLLAAAGVFGGGAAFAHRMQADRIARAYRDRADAARRDGHPDREATYLQRYLALVPNDAAAQVQLANALTDTARRPDDVTEAYYVLQAALRNDPTLPADVRRRAVRLALSPGQSLLTDALRDIDALLKAAPADAELLDLKGRCLTAQGAHAEADAAFAAAVAADPGRAAAYARRADLLRRALNRRSEADRVIGRMTEANPASATAHLLAAEYWREVGDAGRRTAEVEAARRAGPNDPAMLLASADLELARADAAPTAAAGPLAAARDLLARAAAATAGPLPDPKPWAVDPDAVDLRAVAAETSVRLTLVLARQGELAEAETAARAAVERFPTNPVVARQLVDVLVRRNRPDDAERELSRLQAAGARGGVWEYERGRVAMVRERWAEAARLLDAAALQLANRPAAAREAQLLAARCYERLGDLPRRYEAYKRAVPDDVFDPAFVPAVTGLAAALAEMGRPAEAAAEYRRAVTRSPAAALPLARLTAWETLRRPAAARDWATVDALVEKAPAGPDREVTRALILAARGDVAGADAVLAAAAAAHPDAAEVWVLRTRSALGGGRYDQAASLLREATAKAGDRPEFAPLAARAAAKGDKAALAREARRQADAAAGRPPAERGPLLRALAGLAAEADDRRLARDLADRAAADLPNDLRLHVQRVELALLDADEPAATRLLERVDAAAGGADAAEARTARGVVLLWKGERGDKAAVGEAVRLFAAASADRETAPRPHAGLGRAADLRGDKAEAARRYRRAVDLGERSPDVLRRLLELYAECRQFAEAEAVVRAAADAGTGLGGGEAAAAGLMAGAGNFARAAELAAKAVPADARDPKQLLWLGQLLALGGRPEDAVAPLRRAADLAPDAPDAWVALVQLLARLNRPDEARQAATAAKGKIRPADAAFAGPLLDEAVGRREEAAAGYAALLKARPADPAALRAASGFRIRAGDADGAVPVLEKLLALPGRTPDDEGYARRALGLCLCVSKDRATARRGLALLGIADPATAGAVAGTEPIDDLRVRAAVLAGMPGRKTRQAAAAVLEGMEARAPLASSDQFLLGRVYAALGDWEKARRRSAAAADGEPSNALYAAQAAAVALRAGAAADGKLWADRLFALAPKAPKAVELRARAATATGDPAGAVAAAEGFVAGGGSLLLAAAVLEAAGLPDRAEGYYRKAAAPPAGPAERLALPAFLARHGRAAEAVGEYERLAGAAGPLEVAAGMTEAVLNAPTPPPALVERVTARLAALPPTPAARVMLAAVKAAAGDYPASAALCRQTLAEEPANAVALNNLAYLVAMVEGRHEEGLRMVRRAEEIAGPVPTFLDTEAVILLAAGDAAKAIDLLLETAADEPTGVTYYHLAQAYAAAGRPADARAAVAEARKLRMSVVELFPFERPQFDKTMAALGG
jgi:predicted Zn-dependent protease